MLDTAHIHVIGETLRASSFPSGHVVTASAIAAVLFFASRKRLLTALWVLPLATLIAVSRVAVGAHWPADLAAGVAGGWVAGALGVVIAARWRVWNTPRGVRIMALVVIGIGVALTVANVFSPTVRVASPRTYEFTETRKRSKGTAEWFQAGFGGPQ